MSPQNLPLKLMLVCFRVHILFGLGYACLYLVELKGSIL